MLLVTIYIYIVHFHNKGLDLINVSAILNEPDMKNVFPIKVNNNDDATPTVIYKTDLEHLICSGLDRFRSRTFLKNNNFEHAFQP